ncbi:MULTISPECIES: Hsp20/alpha crystallin family protein [unclassified Roseateles]|uniref:Hsp20/alpha crystallin family protein n=1 Tax=unclassified Roseateles TaxID=2626991 RepID=UPI00161AFC58|nr:MULTISPECIES: Hsp20/alpha crystallin family protein [unclassified Roseateles]MBB3293217.1 HSP20 family molecular chaperone IbpA [Mitsuaria sp. BK041]MBB3362434.1 HSP20 family molecular chaperone IbpA [Mitsuaria sp. BK045]
MSTHTQLTRADGARAELASTGQNAPAGKPVSGPRAVAEPAVEIFEDAGGITLLADMPGVPREALDVRLDGETLVIEGEAAVSAPDGMRPLWAEVSVPRFRRAFTLSRELDMGRIEAGMKDGVLTLRIPKQAHAQPRRIAVSTG